MFLDPSFYANIAQVYAVLIIFVLIVGVLATLVVFLFGRLWPDE